MPGIGSVTSECSSNHASATWYDCGVVCVGNLLDGVNSRDRPGSDWEVENEADAVVLTSVEDVCMVVVQPRLRKIKEKASPFTAGMNPTVLIQPTFGILNGYFKC